MDSNTFKHTYIPLLTVLLITALVALFNAPIMATLWRYSFDDGTYSHAYLIPFIVGYLFYILAKESDLTIRKQLHWPAVIMFLLSCYILFVFSAAQISLLYWSATLLLLCTAINLVFNSSIKLFFPPLYFIFLIPVWGIITIPLQSLSVMAVNTLMGFTSIPVYVEQEFVHIPSGIFEIADGCSGLRYMITSLAIGSLFSFLYLRTVKNISIFIAIAILGALLTNWLRIAALIIIGHQTEMTSPLMEDHNMFGWYLYIPFMLLLFKFGGYLIDKETSSNETKSKVSEKQTINWKVISLLTVGLLVSSTIITMPDRIESPTQSTAIHPLIHHYSSVNVINNSAEITQLLYHFNGKNLETKPTFFDNEFVPEGWEVTSQDITHESNTLEVKKGLNTAIINIRYEIAGKKIGSPSKFKLERIKQALMGVKSTQLHWQFELQ